MTFLSSLRKCNRIMRLSTWRCYLSIFILRNVQKFNETDWEGIFKDKSYSLLHICLATYTCVVPQFGYTCCDFLTRS